jgi:hypothetical protein
MLLIAALTWYTFVTLYIAFKGATDIREMLEKLGKRRDE